MSGYGSRRLRLKCLKAPKMPLYNFYLFYILPGRNPSKSSGITRKLAYHRPDRNFAAYAERKSASATDLSLSSIIRLGFCRIPLLQ
jgi:hypothetical protein